MDWKPEWDRRDDESSASWMSRVTSDPDALVYASEKAIQEHFVAGRPIAAADKVGVFKKWPDGRKDYIKKWADSPPQY